MCPYKGRPCWWKILERMIRFICTTATDNGFVLIKVILKRDTIMYSRTESVWQIFQSVQSIISLTLILQGGWVGDIEKWTSWSWEKNDS